MEHTNKNKRVHSPVGRVVIAPVKQLAIGSANTLKRGLQLAIKPTKSENITDALNVDVAEPDRHRIVIEEGNHPFVTDQIEEVFVESAKQERIFQRGGEITRIISLHEPQRGSKIDRPSGCTLLEPLSRPALLDVWERMMLFVRRSIRTGGIETFTPINCPTRIGSGYMSRRGSWKLPTLTGIITAPLMRLDGTILNQPGYDEQTGLFLADGCRWLDVPSRPTHSDAKAALKTLCGPFTEFPFCKPADRAVAIASILTALQRRLLPACPMFGFSAPASRTGKSLLAEAVAIIATGKSAPATAISRVPEEFRKTLLAILREGSSIINFDNVEHPIKSPDLCKILTQPEFSDRILGETKTLTLPTNVLWLITGNNLLIRGDLTRRTLLCRIDSGKERPDERKFEIKHLKSYLVENRAALVRAALTILKAFHSANLPKQNVPPWGGFDEWSSLIREALIWAGMADPCQTRGAVIDLDPERECILDLLKHLYTLFPRSGFTAMEVVQRANDQLGRADARCVTNNNLHGALVGVARAKDGTLDTNMVGQWMKRSRGQIVQDLKLERANAEGTNPARWKVTKV
jgi:putative DNA primase/helicase